MRPSEIDKILEFSTAIEQVANRSRKVRSKLIPADFTPVGGQVEMFFIGTCIYCNRGTVHEIPTNCPICLEDINVGFRTFQNPILRKLQIEWRRLRRRIRNKLNPMKPQWVWEVERVAFVFYNTTKELLRLATLSDFR